MKRVGRFSTLLLDCDGVIVNSEELAEAAELAVLKEYGLHLGEHKYRDLVLGSTNSGYIDDIQQRIHDATGVRLPADQLTHRLHDARWAAYESGLMLTDGMEDILTQFRPKLAIVSSSEIASVERKLALAGINDLSDVLIISQESERQSKAQAYLTAARSLQSPIAQCLAVEDSPAGVSAARSTGITVWALALREYPTAEQLYEAGATRIIGAGSELRRELSLVLT